MIRTNGAYERFVPTSPVGEFFHSRIRTMDHEIIYSTWMSDDRKGFGILSWFDADQRLLGEPVEPAQALVSIKIMQAWFGLYDAVHKTAEASTDRDPDAFEVRMELPVIMLTDGEVETFDFGYADDVLDSVKVMLVQGARFVPLMDTKCVSCKEAVGVENIDLGGLNEDKWSPIRINGDSKWGYAPFCSICNEDMTAEVTSLISL